jgi:hypothetical protein
LQSIPYGCELSNLDLRSSAASKKADERSEFRVAFDLAFAFSQSHVNMQQKLPQRIERKRDSIEFERSENQGQFFKEKGF